MEKTNVKYTLNETDLEEAIKAYLKVQGITNPVIKISFNSTMVEIPELNRGSMSDAYRYEVSAVAELG